MSQKITFLLLVLLIATSCVDRQSQNEDPFRVKAPGQRQLPTESARNFPLSPGRSALRNCRSVYRVLSTALRSMPEITISETISSLKSIRAIFICELKMPKRSTAVRKPTTSVSRRFIRKTTFRLPTTNRRVPHGSPRRPLTIRLSTNWAIRSFALPSTAMSARSSSKSSRTCVPHSRW